MSRRIPVIGGRERPVNLGVALREAFIAVNDLVLARLADRGHTAIRPAHSTVFQYLDDTGTTVSLLAERAQMTKQAMAELVADWLRNSRWAALVTLRSFRSASKTTS